MYQLLTHWRYYSVCSLLVGALLLIGYKLVHLRLTDYEFLVDQGNARTVRVDKMSTQRGAIVDRNGQTLALSIPSFSLWIDPVEILKNPENRYRKQWKQLAVLLDMELAELNQKVSAKATKRFVYLARQMDPNLVEVIASFTLPGVHLKQESKRYYPSAEVSAHLIGFTNIDDKGQTGLESAYDNWLLNQDGERTLVKDARGRVIEPENVIQESRAGNNLTLSLDNRIQFIAYRALKKAVHQHRSTSGSVVILDVETGEVLALANQPSFNPNNLSERQGNLYRNRAVTDAIEPGSTMKPFVVAKALEDNLYQPNSLINTSPGRVRVDGRWIRDVHNYGELSLQSVITKSSNVGVTKVVEQVGSEPFLSFLFHLGFGTDTGTGFPGENAGYLNVQRTWSDFELSTLAFGYGLTVTPLQLAQAYATIGNDGMRMPVSFLKTDGTIIGERVLTTQVARDMVAIMETVVSDEGTARMGQVKGYRVAGKTGTVRKAVNGGYGDDYIAIFAGLAPVSNPRLAMVVVIDEPKGEKYYGGQVAAPVFSEVAGEALRLLNVPPDKKANRSLFSSSASSGIPFIQGGA